MFKIKSNNIYCYYDRPVQFRIYNYLYSLVNNTNNVDVFIRIKSKNKYFKKLIYNKISYNIFWELSDLTEIVKIDYNINKFKILKTYFNDFKFNIKNINIDLYSNFPKQFLWEKG
jgi:hypothetical protein